MNTEFMLDTLSNSTKSLKISCNDGYIIINPLTFNFSYSGKFGRLVNNHIITHNAKRDIAKKIIILQKHMEIYSAKIGGFSITQI